MNDDDLDGPTNCSQVVLDLIEATDDDETMLSGRGSHAGKCSNLDCNFGLVSIRRIRHFFGENPSYDGSMFCRRYEISRDIYSRLHSSVVGHDSYFIHQKICFGMQGISSRVKVTAALRMLAHGLPPDAVDDSPSIAVSTSRETLKRFCIDIIESLGTKHIRTPILEEVTNMLRESENRGTPGLLGSIGCSE